MTAGALTEQQTTRLRRYMTPAGYDLALSTFGERGILDAVSEHGDQLRLAAADLLEGLPSPSGEASGLSSFKLDVLEFKFQSSKAVSTDWLTIAARLREQAKTDAGLSSAVFGPVIDDWGVEP